MYILEVVNSLSLVTIAVSVAVIALRLTHITSHLQSLSTLAGSLVPVLLEYLARVMVHDPDPHHHYFMPAARNRVVWEWRDQQWVLRPESGPLDQAGLPPNRPGSYDGECVTTPKKS